MRKIVAAILLCGIVLAANAVPARRGWQTRTQADGSSIEVQVIGDEFYHYTINREGKQVRLNEAGMYEVVGEAPSAEVVKARRAKGVARRQRKEVGTEPYPAPRGLLILANFSDKKFNTSNSKAVMDSLINAKNCQVNNGHGSAAQYFKDQSHGLYQPVFDVVGPVTLSNSQSYYGQNVGSGDDAEDKYATDAVIEACILANSQVNFADYDWNNDGYVDFVYVIYAGKGEADGGGDNTIWPHNYSIQEVIKYAAQYPDEVFCNYTKSQTKLDGKYLDNYAMSQELDGQTGARSGNGTFCHEFGHVIGLPDFYDTSYKGNYNNELTPNEWDIMDGGGYNGNGHCPPNYSAWEKYFMGWLTPENLGSEGANLTLYPNGSAQQNAYQINTAGKLQTATTEGLNYYIECRQKTGWDSYVPAAGMLIWKVNFNAQMWENNAPNLTSNGNPHYTLIIPSGTKIGSSYGDKNVWPYSSTNSWSGVSGKPLLNIAKSGNNITLTYIEEPAVDPFNVVFKSNGTNFATKESTGKLVLPANEPAACQDGRVFVGWCSQANYNNPTTAPTFATAGQAVSEGAVFYAVFADQEGEGSAETTWDLVSSASSLQAGDVLVLACSSKGYTAGNISSQIMASVSSTFSSNKNQITSLGSETVELTLGGSAGAWTLSSTSGLLGATAVKKLAWGSGTTTWTISISSGDATIQSTTDSYGRFLYNVNSPRFTTYTSNTSVSMLLPQLYRKTGGGATYSNFSTSCGQATDVETVVCKPTAVKAIRNGQLVIIRGEEVYSITGERIE